MNKWYLLFLFYLLHLGCFAQTSLNDEHSLRQKEDSLKIYSQQMDEGIGLKRFNADSIFTKVLVRALKTNNSFFYSFDSLKKISILYAPDSNFRIITWQLELDNNTVFQHGTIQMKTADGSLKLFPLIDKSKVINDIDDTVTDNKNWVGAVYYKIIETQNKGQKFYTLLGYDEDYELCNRKIIEVLTFNENDEPVFGGPYFTFGKTLVIRKPIARYVMEYKKDAAAKLNYDPDMDMIISEHLISESGEPNKKWTLIGDGDYEGFKWINGKWIHVDKVFTQITPEGQVPTPQPLKNNNGNLLEDKLSAPPDATPKHK